MVFITGATGYMGRRLAAELQARGRQVTALVRPGSEAKAPPGCVIVTGDALNAGSYGDRVPRGCTFVHLVGVPHPSPAKAAEFQAIDLPSIRAAVKAAVKASATHFIYVSVAHPAPMMNAYIAVRSEGEALIRAAGLNATILRPWYVLGPGHWWPVVLRPAYWIMEQVPSTRQSAQRLGLVTLAQMIGAMVGALENPASGVRLIEVPEIRRDN